MPELPLAGGGVEYQLIDGADDAAPLVFLHEGLGSIDLWRGFPTEVAERLGRPAIVYSRHGHGRSAPITGPRRVSYMHHEALDVLPELLGRLGVERPLLVGHSDGASIAIIYAGSGLGPVEGLVLLAPHVFVEERSVQGIAAARETYRSTNLPDRMAKYHVDADATFWGWNRIWLAPEFRDWNIEEYLPAIDRPVLLVQGEDDEYGTVAQLDAVAAGVRSPVVERLLLPGCGHAPHLDRPAETVAAVVRFIGRLQEGEAPPPAR